MDAPITTHPTDETLEAYGLGKLDDAAAEGVREHVGDCSECRRRVGDADSDSFLHRLRAAEGRHSPPHPPEDDGTKRAWAAAVPASPVPARSVPLHTLPTGLEDHPDYEILRDSGAAGWGSFIWPTTG